MPNTNLVRQIAIIEDHPVCVMAVRSALQAADPSLLVEDFSGIADFAASGDPTRFKLVVLDLNVSDGKGLSNLTTVRDMTDGSPIVIFSADDRPDTASAVRALGARAFISKVAPFDQVSGRILAVLSGEYEPDAAPVESSEAIGEAGAINLSRAQWKVANAMINGQSNKVIAYELGLSEPTIKSHMSAIFRALGVTNRSQAILRLQALDLLG